MASKTDLAAGENCTCCDKCSTSMPLPDCKYCVNCGHCLAKQAQHQPPLQQQEQVHQHIQQPGRHVAHEYAQQGLPIHRHQPLKQQQQQQPHQRSRTTLSNPSPSPTANAILAQPTGQAEVGEWNSPDGTAVRREQPNRREWIYSSPDGKTQERALQEWGEDGSHRVLYESHRILAPPSGGGAQHEAIDAPLQQVRAAINAAVSRGSDAAAHIAGTGTSTTGGGVQEVIDRDIESMRHLINAAWTVGAAQPRLLQREIDGWHRHLWAELRDLLPGNRSLRDELWSAIDQGLVDLRGLFDWGSDWERLNAAPAALPQLTQKSHLQHPGHRPSPGQGSLHQQREVQQAEAARHGQQQKHAEKHTEKHIQFNTQDPTSSRNLHGQQHLPVQQQGVIPEHKQGMHAAVDTTRI